MKIVRNRRQAGYIFLALAWILFAGFGGPALISAPSDIAVLLGIVVFSALAIATIAALPESAPEIYEEPKE